MRIVKERSDLCYLVSAAIKTTYNTRSPGGVERCIDVLNQLKYLSLSVKDIQLSESIFNLEILRNHRNPKICKEAQALFNSWMKTLYAQGGDKPLKAGLILDKISLKPKKQKPQKAAKDSANPKSAIVTTKTELVELKKKKRELVELFEKAQRSANVAKAKGILLGRAEASRCVEALSLLMRINLTPKATEPRRMVVRLEGLTKHKDRKIRGAALPLLQLWRQKIREQERKDSFTKTFPKNPRKAR
ncbi:unnamed protein product [Arabis nemorensis]|uniref:TFIIS N-terminal domain-containing protein n=1 Tax=Arabis nemorensis TaxID=586526 RepID=A0A565C1A3_9BRAS|nr:unnamed protein product [Arabis nemorensis]